MLGIYLLAAEPFPDSVKLNKAIVGFMKDSWNDAPNLGVQI